MSESDLAALLLSDIAAIRTAAALRVWGLRWAPEIQATGERDMIAAKYQERMTELEQNECLSTGQNTRRTGEKSASQSRLPLTGNVRDAGSNADARGSLSTPIS